MRSANLVLVLFLALLSPIYSWVWQCNKGNCKRTRQASGTSYPSLEVCRLVCGKYGALWPMPTLSTKLSDQLVEFDNKNVIFKMTNKSRIGNFLGKNFRLFADNLGVASNCQSPNTMVIETETSDNSLSLTWDTDESYALDIQTEGKNIMVKIQATSVFGARHGLETLSQLIELYKKDDNSSCLVIGDSAKIRDKPFYPHRGFMLDTARNFLPISVIKKNIDAMAASKLNVLHWHMTDSQSFPMESKRVPQMAEYGAYSPNQVYHTEELKQLVHYAKLRGVRIIIELDAPAHAGNGWQWGPEHGLGNLTVCHEEKPWRKFCIQPPCGQLNPVNPNVYKILKDIYADIMDILPKGEVFHMGGDEIFLPCWNSTPEILEYLKDKPLTTETFLDLWGDYQAKATNALDTVVGNEKTPLIVWNSDLTNTSIIQKYLPPSRYIIQIWLPAADPTPINLAALGYKLILSTYDAWYLDHGIGRLTYHTWFVVYDNKLPKNGVLGGETCMWGELVDGYSMESRAWPRAAAAAERLWTNPDTSSIQAQSRFYRHRERLVKRGINAGSVIPMWCYQNEGECV